jgi:hypothetical protein
MSQRNLKQILGTSKMHTTNGAGKEVPAKANNASQ